MSRCINHRDRHADFFSPENFCDDCWWDWWYCDYSDEDLRRIIRGEFGSEYPEIQNATRVLTKRAA